MFLKSVGIFKLFYYAIFGSVILKLLFLKMGF
ncbi:membrane protein [Helicobacter pylori]|nr:membrane protein [Helicobacter pylori]